MFGIYRRHVGFATYANGCFCKEDKTFNMHSFDLISSLTPDKQVLYTSVALLREIMEIKSKEFLREIRNVKPYLLPSKTCVENFKREFSAWPRDS